MMQHLNIPRRAPAHAVLLVSFVLLAILPGRKAVGQGVSLLGRAGEVALALRSISVERVGRLELDPSGKPRANGEPAASEVTVELGLGSRDPDALAALTTGPLVGVRFRAADDRGQVLTHVGAEVIQESSVDRVESRLRVKLRGPASPARTLRSLEGALLAYPKARRIRFHVPWSKEDLPVAVEYGEGRATLRRFHLVGDESTLWVALLPPAGFRVAPLEHPGTLTARAMDIYGNLVSGGAITETVQTQTGKEPEFRFYAPVLRRIPSRLMLDVVCVAGEPRAVPFRTGSIPLPRSR